MKLQRNSIRGNGGRRWALLLALCLAVALGVAACGGDDSAAPAEPASTGNADADTARAKIMTTLAGLLELEGSTDVRSEWPTITESSCYPAKQVTDRPLVVGYAYAERGNTWQVQNGDGGTWFLENHPDVGEVISLDGEQNPDKQIADVQSLISQEVDLIVLNPATTAVSPAAQQACDAGIPVVVYDRFVEPDTDITASLYADEIQDGYNGGKAIVDTLGGEGKVAILGGIPGIGVTEDRMEGARVAFREAPGIEVIAEGFSNYDPATGRQIVEEWLLAFDQIDAIWSDSGLQAVGAVGALEEAGRLDEVKMIAGGQFNQYLRLWSELGFLGYGSTISSDVGMLAAQLGIDIVRGRVSPQANVPGPLVVITDDTLDQYFRPDLPDAYWASDHLPDSVLLDIYAE